MRYALRFSPEVEDDAVAGYEWYEKKTRGLGEEFLRAFNSTVTEISRRPMLCSETGSGFRRKLLRRFPYAIYYILHDRQITVFGFFHCARDPARIERHLQDRSSK